MLVQVPEQGGRIWECPAAALPRSHNAYCVKRTLYQICFVHTHTHPYWLQLIPCTGAYHWCTPLVHTTGMPYQPATLQTCEPCPANRDNSQTTAAWSELSVVAHDRGLRSLPAGHNLYHSYQFNEWYRQIYSPLIQSEPKTLYNNIYHHLDKQTKPNFSLFQALLVLADLGWSQENAEAVSFLYL